MLGLRQRKTIIADSRSEVFLGVLVAMHFRYDCLATSQAFRVSFDQIEFASFDIHNQREISQVIFPDNLLQSYTWRFSPKAVSRGGNLSSNVISVVRENDGIPVVVNCSMNW